MPRSAVLLGCGCLLLSLSGLPVAAIPVDAHEGHVDLSDGSPAQSDSETNFLHALPTTTTSSMPSPSCSSTATEPSRLCPSLSTASATTSNDLCQPPIYLAVDGCDVAPSESIPPLGSVASSVALSQPDGSPASGEQSTSFLDRKDVQRASLLLGDISSIMTIIAVLFALTANFPAWWAARR